VSSESDLCVIDQSEQVSNGKDAEKDACNA
jgi:hypothetical protein